MRPRTDQGHVAPKHVHELRQFVDAGRTQQFANPSDARIARRGLGDRWTVLFNLHRAELEHHELLTVKPFAVLPKYDWTPSIKFNGERGERQDRNEDHQRKETEKNMKRALDEALSQTERSPLNLNRQYSLPGRRSVVRKRSDLRIGQKLHGDRQKFDLLSNKIDPRLIMPGERE